MFDWKYNSENYKGDVYKLVPPGQYRVRIEDAEETVSKSSGKPMIKLTLKVSGFNSRVWYYLVLDNSTPEGVANTDNRLGRIYDSFKIPAGSQNLEEWKGKVGGANIKNEPDNQDNMRASVSYFLVQSKQADLPPWQEDEPKGTLVPEMAGFYGSEIPF